QADYNDALARLTILEGIIAIAQTMESGHNSLRHIKEKDINKAIDDLDTFNDTFVRAKLIDASLKLKANDKSIWDDYDGQNVFSLRKYLNHHCKVEKKHRKFPEFCAQY